MGTSINIRACRCGRKTRIHSITFSAHSKDFFIGLPPITFQSGYQSSYFGSPSVIDKFFDIGNNRPLAIHRAAGSCVCLSVCVSVTIRCPASNINKRICRARFEKTHGNGVLDLVVLIDSRINWIPARAPHQQSSTCGGTCGLVPIADSINSDVIITKDGGGKKKTDAQRNSTITTYTSNEGFRLPDKVDSLFSAIRLVLSLPYTRVKIHAVTRYTRHAGEWKSRLYS